MNEQKKIKKRIISYIILFVSLQLGYFLLNGFVWKSEHYLHTMLEIIASFFALFAGILALVHYYNKQNNLTLIIGVALINSFILDMYQALVTSPVFISLFPSNPLAIVNWSYFSSRLFLPVLLCISPLALIKTEKSNTLNGNIVYLLAAILIIINFEFISFAYLPSGYYHFFIYSKAEELIPAFFYFLAFIIFLQKGLWRREDSYHWIMFSLIVGFMEQFAYMAFSKQPFDTMFIIAHLLEISSYLLVITGLLISIFSIFKQEKYNKERLRSILDNITDCVITTDINGIIESCNPAIFETFGYIPPEVTGRNIDMLIPKVVLGNNNMCFIKEGDAFLFPHVIDRNFELVGIRKNYVNFPVELGINEVQFGNKSMFILIIRDISQHKEVVQLKDEFISIVNHELRTPLTSIRGSLGLILGKTFGEVPNQIEKMLDIAYKNTIRLISLVNDILDVEKIEAGKIEFKMESYELIPLVKEAIEANENYAQQYNVKIEFKENLPSDTRVLVDKNRLVQVITNLISNAAKFSPPDNNIEISIFKYNQTIRVSITDYGAGIPEEFRNKIFEKFAQADSSITRQRGGTGLGLNISKLIIEALGGYIGFNTKINAGTTFYFDLPEWQKLELPEIMQENS